MRKLNRTDIENILLGCTILGTGGGGPLENGMALIDEALAAGKEFVLASFDEVSPDTYIGTPYGCGAISPLTEEDIKKYERLPLPEKSIPGESRTESISDFPKADTAEDTFSSPWCCTWAYP